MDIIKKDSSSVVLRANKLLKTINKILKHYSTDLVDSSWIDNFYKWADKYEIPDTIIPRDKAKLLELDELNLTNLNLDYIPPEIGKLKNLKGLYLGNNKIGEL